MKRNLLNILCCPKCNGDLTLFIASETDTVIIEGKLRCSSCGIVYPIEDGIPNMLPPGKR